MKYILAAVLFVLLSLPITVNAATKGTVKFTAGVAGGNTRINAISYTVVNDGTNDFFWTCETSGTPGIASTDAELKSGESIEIPYPCGTMTWDTTTGNAVIRIFYFTR